MTLGRNGKKRKWAGILIRFLHAHVWARYAYETEERRKYPVWFYPREELYAPEVMFDPAKHNDIKLKLARRLQELQEDYR